MFINQVYKSNDYNQKRNYIEINTYVLNQPFIDSK